MIEQLWRDVKNAGFLANALWRGKPLLRQDLDQFSCCPRENENLSIP